MLPAKIKLVCMRNFYFRVINTADYERIQPRLADIGRQDPQHCLQLIKDLLSSPTMHRAGTEEAYLSYIQYNEPIKREEYERKRKISVEAKIKQLTADYHEIERGNEFTLGQQTDLAYDAIHAFCAAYDRANWFFLDFLSFPFAFFPENASAYLDHWVNPAATPIGHPMHMPEVDLTGLGENNQVDLFTEFQLTPEAAHFYEQELSKRLYSNEQRLYELFKDIMTKTKDGTHLTTLVHYY